MTGNVITVLAVVIAIVWLGLMVVSALRSRRGEEVARNLQPGINDQQLETNRLERGQRAAIAFSAFLAISLPLYFLGETSRQEGFEEEFADASVERGEHIVEEFGCFEQCHGPLGVGGSASFVEQRSGITVSWAAPPLNDVFYRYDEDEVNFWVTFGRGNTPMPAWGLAGGGPMNESQVEDVVNYLETIQITQQEVVDQTPSKINEQLTRLAGAEETMRLAIIRQRQVVAEIDQAPRDADVITAIAEEASDLLDEADEGIDTDADGLSDFAETEISRLTTEAVDYFRVVEPVTLDPATADDEKVEQVLAQLEEAASEDPIFEIYITRIETVLEAAGEGDDTDGDGLSDQAEAQISGLTTEAAGSTVPDSVVPVNLDPANDESVAGQPDVTTARDAVGGLGSAAINISVLDENSERIRANQEAGLRFLEQAQEERAWQIDISGVAEAVGISEEDATRAVGLFNANCARCHTAGFSAGIPYTREAGSGGMGPALWDGRPVVQFGEATEDTENDLLIQFLINGSEAQEPYGLNGFGTGRMPSFGPILDLDDLQLLARYLRSGDLNGMGE
jgi:mono/diheme cytochrome c family protein